MSEGERIFVRSTLGSRLALMLAEMVHASRSAVVVTADEEQAHSLVGDLRYFNGEEAVLHLPAVDSSPYAEISPDRAAIQARMATLWRLRKPLDGQILVCSAAALRRRVIPRETLKARSRVIHVGDPLDRDALGRELQAAGFSSARVVEDPATFALRGGLVDLYPPADRFPSRIELDGDRVDSIRRFDPATQRTLRVAEEVQLYPVRETIVAPGFDLRPQIFEAADRASFPSRATRTLLEAIESGREFIGLDALTPAFHPSLSSLWSYLVGDPAWVVVDPPAVARRLEQEDDRAETGHRSRMDDHRLSFPPDRFFVGAAEIAAYLEKACTLSVGGESRTVTPAIDLSCRDNADLVAELRRARAERGEAILGALVARIDRWTAQGRLVLIAAGTVGQCERLEAMLRVHGLEPRLHLEAGVGLLLAGDVRAPGVVLTRGSVSAGFRLEDGLVLLAEQEIFGPKIRRRKSTRRAGLSLSDLRQLQPGHHVVHTLHGVGVYRGLSQLEVAGVPADFLQLEYAGGDRLYLPVYRMDQVHKFVAGDAGDRPPRLDRLGGITWQKKKRKVEAAVRKFSEELLQLYAQRAALSGTAHDAPDTIFDEFAATFPYTETPDQRAALDEVIADLTAGQPMDRLVCGDVGFGKTEVALRAAFLVAMAGKQVAVLAPTTVLVEQHLRTFTERLGPYPLRVASLSRFRGAKEAQQTLAALAAGSVDVIIGTHRLLSKDVRFRELGLLVIDEEQRFGVAHKERIKRLRTQVDVLTLTATPIPRTMQMTMIGLREVSIIATPPEDRLSVRTFISRYDDALVAEALQQELDRGGQAFFVHNRVEDIAIWRDRVAALSPRAKVAVAHGQLESRRLERVMLDFVDGRYDVLVCTTIIESGLDIPRANTMFINRADRFGLAQLYQLRGRIGRSRQRAFCYLLVPGIEAMSDDARQRLLALERFTELGSGFSVATQDLEIRGAGELLGRKQSGQIAAVGFETYARILQEAVAQLKGEPIHRQNDPEINVAVAAFIPDDYVEDIGQRLELYQRLSAAARVEDEVLELLVEIQDRYGPRPDEVDALGTLMIVRGLAAKLGARVLDLTTARLALTLDEATPLDAAEVTRLVRDRSSGFRLTPKMQLIRTLDDSEQRDPLGAAKNILRGLMPYANQPH